MRNRETLLRLLAVSLLAYMLVSFGAARFRLNEVMEQERTLRGECGKLTEENADLRRRISAVNDDGALEAMARDRLGLVMPGERIYYFR